MNKNHTLVRPVLETSSLPITRPNQQSSSSATITKTPPTSRRKPTLGSATMKSGSSRLTVSSHVVVALCEGRGQARGIVGIAALDINKPVLVLCQISNTQTYTNTLTHVNILRPVEVLIPSSLIDCTTTSRIVTLLKDQFPNLTVTSASCSAFRSNRGLNYVMSMCASEFKSVILVIREKLYALASASALIKYIQKEQHIMYPTRSMKIEYQEPEDTAVIDIDSAVRIKLVSSCNHGDGTINLLSKLDHCVTGVGKKMLRATILQPPCIDHVTQARLDCVQELVENAEFRIKLKAVLKNLHNIECVLMFGAMVPRSAAAVSDKQLSYTLQLKTLLINIGPLQTELEGAYHPLFRRIYEQLVKAPYSLLINKIHQIFAEEAHPAIGYAENLKHYFAIRTGLNDFLDITRRTYMEIINEMRAYIQNLSDKYSLPLRIHHTLKRGFHVVLDLIGNMRNMEKSSLPSVFEEVKKNKTNFTMITSEMRNFGVRLQINCQEIESIGNVIIFQLMANIRECIGHLYRLCDDVALLDVLQSLATVSSKPGYIRPTFCTEHMEIIGARHPLLKYSYVKDRVPNNIVASNLHNLHIVTGPNMSGKSIYARQMPLLQVLAQIGCYVPAVSATFRSCTHVYARFSVEDYLHNNNSTTTSTFVLEMTEVQYMLNSLDTGSRALVVLDDLCHSTSMGEDIIIAIAICEKLLKTRTYIFVATHFLSMTKLAEMYGSVSNSHLQVEETVRDIHICIKFAYQLIAGVNGAETYGIELSRICGGSDMTMQSSACPLNIIYLNYRLCADLNLLQLQNKLSAEVERKRLDEQEKLTGEHYEIGQVLSCTSASCGCRTTTSSSTAATSDRQKSKLSNSVYDIARKQRKPVDFDKPITKSTDSKIVDSVFPSVADFLYCTIVDSPELDCADSEHSDSLGVTVKHLDSQSENNVKRKEDERSVDKPLDYDSDFPTYSPSFNLYKDTYSPPYKPHTPESEALIDTMNSRPSPSLNSKEQDLVTFEQKSLFSQRSETNTVISKPSEPINIDINLFGPNEPSANIFGTTVPDFVPFDPKYSYSPPLEISSSASENFQSEQSDSRTSSYKQPKPVNPVPENVFLFTPQLPFGLYDNMGPGSFQYTEEATEYKSDIRYESMNRYGSERRESVTGSTYYGVSNNCVTECGSIENTVQQEETHYASFQEFPLHFLDCWSSESQQSTAPRSTNSTAQVRDCYQSYNVNPSTSGYQSNVCPNQQISRITIQHTNTDDITYPSTSEIQANGQYNTESVPPNPNFEIEPRIEPIQKPVNFPPLLSDKPKEKTCGINLKPSVLKKPVNNLEMLPCTSKSQTPTKRVSSPLFKHEKKTEKQKLTVPEAYMPPRRAKTAKLTVKTPCYLEESPKE